MRTAVIIVNYRMAEMVVRCLESLFSWLKKDEILVFVADNNSCDDSIAIIKEFIHANELWSKIILVPLPNNGGFAYGNNQAIKYVSENYSYIDYFWLLNPDTYLLSGKANDIKELFRNKKIGIVGTRIVSSVTNQLESSAFNIPTPFSEFLLGAKCGPLFRLFPKQTISFPSPDIACQCDWVSGASMIIRKEVFESVSGMDEGFFLYYEEIDLCLRAKQKDWEIWHDPRIVVVHEDKSSTGVETTETRRPAFWYDSRRRYYLKHFGVTGLILADMGWFVGRLTLLMRYYLGLRASLEKDPQRFMADLLIGDIKAVCSLILKKSIL